MPLAFVQDDAGRVRLCWRGLRWLSRQPRVVTLDADGRRKRLRVRLARTPLSFLGRWLEVPYDDWQALRLELRGGAAVEEAVLVVSAAGEQLRLPLEVAALDRHDEGLDLLARLARTTGGATQGYREGERPWQFVRRRRQGGTTVYELLRHDEQGAQRLPAIDSPADYTAAATVWAQPPRSPPVNLDSQWLLPLYIPAALVVVLGPPIAGFWLAGIAGLLAGIFLTGLFAGSLDENEYDEHDTHAMRVTMGALGHVLWLGTLAAVMHGGSLMLWRLVAPIGMAVLLVLFILGGGLPSLRLTAKHWRSLIRDAGVLLYAAAVVYAWL